MPHYFHDTGCYLHGLKIAQYVLHHRHTQFIFKHRAQDLTDSLIVQTQLAIENHK